MQLLDYMKNGLNFGCITAYMKWCNFKNAFVDEQTTIITLTMFLF